MPMKKMFKTYSPCLIISLKKKKKKKVRCELNFSRVAEIQAHQSLMKMELQGFEIYIPVSKLEKTLKQSFSSRAGHLIAQK